MTAASTLLAELEQEMSTTRRLLERVPAEKGEWKPHAKSFSLGHLSQLVARIPNWIANTIGKPSWDISTAPKYSYYSTEQLLAEFDANVIAARKAIESASEGDYAKPWNLMYGDRVLFTSPAGSVVRTHINHHVHHRGQLTVYLRLIDVPLPQIYGPTADEGM